MKLNQSNKDVDVSLIGKDVDNYDPMEIIRISGLSKQLKALMADFLVMEEYFFRKAIEKVLLLIIIYKCQVLLIIIDYWLYCDTIIKATKIDKYEEGNITSSCVGDIFYILKECLTRVISTSDVDCLISMVNLISQSLEVDYIAMIQKRLLAAFATTEPKDSKIGYMVNFSYLIYS